MRNLYQLISTKNIFRKFQGLLMMLLIVTISSTPSYSAEGQNMNTTRISLTVKNERIKNVFKLIEQKSSFKIGYNSSVFNSERMVSLNANNEPVVSVLKQLLAGYEGSVQQVDEQHILLKVELQKPVEPAQPRQSQQAAAIRVTGSVKDEEGLPLIGVSVAVKGTSKGTTTNDNGQFELNAEPTDILVFQYIGFNNQEVAVKNQTTIDVVLKANNQSLREVVVVGYGTQSRSTLTGAVGSVGLDKLTSRSFRNVQEALQGKAAGVTVNNNGGDPTAAPQVNIRGLGGINGEQPLYVVDGSVFYPGIPALNPNDIESISVLKDASAAIYGSRASGGVILITTKKGTKGKLSINFDAKYGVENAWRMLQPLNAKEYADVYNTATDAAGRDRLPAFDATLYPDGQITRTNWMDEIFRTGQMQDYNLGLSSGNENTNFYMSFNYRKGQGILLNTFSERYAYRINSDHKINKWLKVGENLSFTNTNGRGTNTFSGYTGAIQAAIFYPPSITPRTSTGAYSGLPVEYAGSYGDVVNPVANLERIDSSNPINTIIANPYLEATILPGLRFRSNYSITKVFNYYKNFSPIVPEVGKPVLTNTLSEASGNENRFLAEQTLNYTKTFGKHNFDVLGGYTY